MARAYAAGRLQEPGKKSTKITLRVVSLYRTVTTDTLMVLVNIHPVELYAKERRQVYQGRKSSVKPRNVKDECRDQEYSLWWHGSRDGKTRR